MKLPLNWGAWGPGVGDPARTVGKLAKLFLTVASPSFSTSIENVLRANLKSKGEIYS